MPMRFKKPEDYGDFYGTLPPTTREQLPEPEKQSEYTREEWGKQKRLAAWKVKAARRGETSLTEAEWKVEERRAQLKGKETQRRQAAEERQKAAAQATEERQRTAAAAAEERQRAAAVKELERQGRYAEAQGRYAEAEERRLAREGEAEEAEALSAAETWTKTTGKERKARTKTIAKVIRGVASAPAKLMEGFMHPTGLGKLLPMGKGVRHPDEVVKNKTLYFGTSNALPSPMGKPLENVMDLYSTGRHKVPPIEARGVLGALKMGITDRDKIAGMTSMSRAKVDKGIAWLQQNGLIEVNRGEII